MSRSSEQYWREREEAQRKKNITEEAAYHRELRRIYADAMDNVQKEIDAFYTRYAGKSGITLAEAKRRVSRMDIDAYSRKAKRYVKEKNFSARANEEMRLYNAAMKINRLELLKANIGLELVSGFDELQRFYDQALTKRTVDEFERQAGILGKSVQNNQKFAHAIVNASFHNATFSERIWANQAALRDELSKQLTRGMIQGRNPRVLARDIQKRFDVSRSDAERLMITELSRVQTEAARQSYERNGYEEYQFLALGTACPICMDLNEQHFKVKDMEPGRNAPPMHPRCRCSTAAYMDRAEFDRWLEEENRRMHERGTASETFRRRIGEQGQEIIDKPTYNKLTRNFLRRGGIIIRGEIADKHLKNQGAYAAYMTGGNLAFIRDDATVSDVLEEMYHAEQDKKKAYGDGLTREILLRREIDAQKHLIAVAKKYKIPNRETEVTVKNLERYLKALDELLAGKEVDRK